MLVYSERNRSRIMEDGKKIVTTECFQLILMKLVGKRLLHNEVFVEMMTARNQIELKALGIDFLFI